MTNAEAFIVAACQISIEMQRTPQCLAAYTPGDPDASQAICVSWHDGAVLLEYDPQEPASLFLRVQPRGDHESWLVSRLAAVSQVLNRDFEASGVSIEVKG
jgi:hypothetical protein